MLGHAKAICRWHDLCLRLQLQCIYMDVSWYESWWSAQIGKQSNDYLLLMQDASFLRKKVAVKTISSRGCPDCTGTEYMEQDHSFLILTVPIVREDGTVITSLKQGIEAEYRQASGQSICCAANGNPCRQQFLVELPDLLIIQLMRFTSEVRFAITAV